MGLRQREQGMCLTDEIRKGIRDNEFEMYYQPVCDTYTGLCCGVEALVRWMRPDGCIVTPECFIQVAEDNGLIIPLTRYILKRTARDISTWHVQDNFRLSVNISPLHLVCHEFIHDMMTFISGVRNNNIRIMVEITENRPVTDLPAAALMLSQLRKQGVIIALDDFGTGYNTFPYLLTLPVDCIKTDKSFIDVITLDDNYSPVLDSIITLGQGLGLEVFAEGVTSEVQREHILSRGVAFVQGYLYSPPLSSDAFQEWLYRNRDMCLSGACISKIKANKR